MIASSQFPDTDSADRLVLSGCIGQSALTIAEDKSRIYNIGLFESNTIPTQYLAPGNAIQNNTNNNAILN